MWVTLNNDISGAIINTMVNVNICYSLHYQNKLSDLYKGYEQVIVMKISVVYIFVLTVYIMKMLWFMYK
jgi:hypothetical protein